MILNEVLREYNAFSQVTRSYQAYGGTVSTFSTPRVDYQYADGSDNTVRLMGMTYPNGRILGYQYDTSFSQVTAIAEGTSILDPKLVTYQYLGLATPVVVTYPQPSRTYSLLGTSGPYSGLDRFGRIVDASWGVARIQYGYNRASSRIWRKDPVAQANSAEYDELYAYDGLQRLGDMQRGTLNGTQTGLTSETFAQCWTLDALGNWGQMRAAATGGAWTLEQERTANTVNEITGISASVGPTWVTPQYDPAGNMTIIPQPKDPTNHYTATYDAWNRLVRLMGPPEPPSSSSSSSSSSSGGELSSSSSSSAPSASSAVNSSSSSASGGEFGTSSSTGDSSSSSSSSSSEPEEIVIAEYDYDARRFRIRERTYTEGMLSETRDVYFTESWQAIEERVPPQTFPWAERQYVWGTRYIDDLILRDKLPFPGTGDPQRLYALQDANWNVIAITDDEGTVQERYAYTAYGEPRFLGPDFTSEPASQFDWHTLYLGRQRSERTGLISIRLRDYSPILGVWLAREIDKSNASFHHYQFLGSSPLGRTDLDGADWIDNTINFTTGALDSLTFHIPYGVRSLYGGNDLLDTSGTAYRSGEWTSTAIEMCATGGSAALKKLATRAARKAGTRAVGAQAAKKMTAHQLEVIGRDAISQSTRGVRGAFKNYQIRQAYRRGQLDKLAELRSSVAHHRFALFGHIGRGPSAMFPSGGLPAWIHSSFSNLKLVRDHVLAHKQLRHLEQVAQAIFHPSGSTLAARFGINQMLHYFNEQDAGNWPAPQLEDVAAMLQGDNSLGDRGASGSAMQNDPLSEFGAAREPIMRSSTIQCHGRGSRFDPLN